MATLQSGHFKDVSPFRACSHEPANRGSSISEILPNPQFPYKMCFQVHTRKRASLISESSLEHCRKFGKVKVVSYTFVRRGMPVRDDIYPEPLACEAGWRVPFLAPFISLVFPQGTHLLLGEQWVSIQSGLRVGLEQ